jgi:lipopolysaccharide transport protein LptA
MKSDRGRPLRYTGDEVIEVILGDTMVLRGAVTITQGSITLAGDRAELARGTGSIIVDAAPSRSVTCTLTTDDGTPVAGEASHSLTYDVAAGLITLSGSASVNTSRGTVTGLLVTLDVTSGISWRGSPSSRPGDVPPTGSDSEEDHDSDDPYATEQDPS